VLLGWRFDWPLTVPASTKHERDGNDEESFFLIGSTEGASHRHVLGRLLQQFSDVYGSFFLSLPLR
jgi:hypothetical protein